MWIIPRVPGQALRPPIICVLVGNNKSTWYIFVDVAVRVRCNLSGIVFTTRLQYFYGTIVLCEQRLSATLAL